jgi:hypothetical protein
LTTEYGSGCGDAVMVLGEDERDGSKKEREMGLYQRDGYVKRERKRKRITPHVSGIFFRKPHSPTKGQ